MDGNKGEKAPVVPPWFVFCIAFKYLKVEGVGHGHLVEGIPPLSLFSFCFCGRVVLRALLFESPVRAFGKGTLGLDPGPWGKNSRERRRVLTFLLFLSFLMNAALVTREREEGGVKKVLMMKIKFK